MAYIDFALYDNCMSSKKEYNIKRKWYTCIPGVPEKAERWIFSTLQTESVAYVYIIR